MLLMVVEMRLLNMMIGQCTSINYSTPTIFAIHHLHQNNCNFLFFLLTPVSWWFFVYCRIAFGLGSIQQTRCFFSQTFTLLPIFIWYEKRFQWQNRLLKVPIANYLPSEIRSDLISKPWTCFNYTPYYSLWVGQIYQKCLFFIEDPWPQISRP